MDAQVGKGCRFPGMRQFSLQAGLGSSRAGQVRDQGTATPETLFALGRAAGVSEEEMLAIGGLIEGTPSEFSQPAQEAAHLVESAQEEDRALLLSILRAAADGLQKRRPEPFYRPTAQASLRIADRPAE